MPAAASFVEAALVGEGVELVAQQSGGAGLGAEVGVQALECLAAAQSEPAAAHQAHEIEAELIGLQLIVAERCLQLAARVQQEARLRVRRQGARQSLQLRRSGRRAAREMQVASRAVAQIWRKRPAQIA